MSSEHERLGKSSKLPNAKAIGQALKIWREAKRLRIKDIAENSKRHPTECKKAVQEPTISQIETQGDGFSYNTLIENILPAYGIKDIGDYDLFLDYCVNHSVETISIVRANERDIHNSSNETQETLVSPDKLRGNRIRISTIEINAGGRTVWQNHPGHEYVMVDKGRVTAEFADTKDTPADRRVQYELNPGDGVAFSSLIYHSFINKNPGPARLIVARPVKGLPKGPYSEL